jgi:hypothetical protein
MYEEKKIYGICLEWHSWILWLEYECILFGLVFLWLNGVLAKDEILILSSD